MRKTISGLQLTFAAVIFTAVWHAFPCYRERGSTRRAGAQAQETDLAATQRRRV